MAKLITFSQYFHYAGWFFNSLLGRKKVLVNTMIINFDCNLRCKHCSIHENDKLLPQMRSMPYQLAEKEIRDGYNKGARILFFEGGEPTLWRDGDKGLSDLIRLGKEIGYYVTGYTTNGTNVLFEDSDVISISLDGPKDMHDRIRGQGVYDRLMSNLAKTEHPNIFANMVVMKENKDVLRATAEVVARDEHINGLMLNFITPPPYEQALSLEEKRQLVEEALQLKKEKMPILNSTRSLREMLIEDYSEKCPTWVSGFVLPDGSHFFGCPMVGTESCKQCGFDAVREYRLITVGNPTAIMQMSKRFAFSK